MTGYNCNLSRDAIVDVIVAYEKVIDDIRKNNFTPDDFTLSELVDFVEETLGGSHEVI